MGEVSEARDGFLDHSQVVKAVAALSERCNSSKVSEGLLGTSEDTVVHLVLQLKKVTNCVRTRKHLKLRLPHGFRDAQNCGLTFCLFAKDQLGGVRKEIKSHEYDKSSTIVKDKLRDLGITCIDEVISYSHFVRAYKTFAAKRELAKSYDRFLVDSLVEQKFLAVLGREFMTVQKLPCAISMKKLRKVPLEVKRVLSQTLLTIGPGTSRIGLGNVGTCAVTTSKLPLLPIYASLESPNGVKLPRKRRLPAPVVDELSTLESASLAKVRVFPTGRVDLLSQDESSKLTERDVREKRRRRNNAKKNAKPKKLKTLKNNKRVKKENQAGTTVKTTVKNVG